MNKDKEPQVLIKLELLTLPSDIPWPIRFRRALKYLLRSCQLRNKGFTTVQINDPAKAICDTPAHR